GYKEVTRKCLEALELKGGDGATWIPKKSSGIDSWLFDLLMAEAYEVSYLILEVEENMISNEHAVKLCLEHEVKRGNKVVKKELIVALRGEIYFVKFIINLEDNDVEPEVIFGRPFLRLTKAITNFRARTVTIYPDIDPFLEETEEEKRAKMIGTICLIST
ncbi:hypothetical protein Tco_0817233, partial [Tanacetum coccineum]